MMNTLKELFLLDPDIVFLNHGSFGATPRPVFDVYQEWQRRFERQPVALVDQEMPAYFEIARKELGDYINAPAGDVVYVPNVTFAINLVARSLPLGPGDEVLTTDHEYGACERAWQFLGKKRGFDVIRQPISLPATTADEMVEELWQGVSPRTRIIFLSHITSFTAQHFPVEMVCERAREAGILTLVDGAHAPGQIALDMLSIGADFYAGNCHKWLCGPKGSAFLYARPERQELIEPLVVSWGWGEDSTFSYGSDYLDYIQWWGTQYPAAYLTIPAAIQFQEEHDWPAVRQRCHEMLRQTIGRICDLTGQPSYYSRDAPLFHQMAITPLPATIDNLALKKQLYNQFRIEIPCLVWRGRPHIRLSVQGYNTRQDLDALIEALDSLLPK
jgi:isopenicillin-N epimerase